MSATKIPVWSWRDAIRKAAIEPLTKLICYALANYMTDAGQAVFPSVETLIQDTGLSNRSVATHLQKAVDAGLLLIERRHNAKGHRCGTRYIPCFPENAELARQSERPAPAKAPDEPPSSRRTRLSEPDAGLSEGGSRQNSPSGTIHPAAAGAREGFSIEELRDKLLDAAGGIVTSTAMAEPQRWLAAGYDLDADILPVIKAKVAHWTRGNISSWAFFTKAIAAAHATRLAPIEAAPPTAAPTPRPDRPKSWSQRQAELRAQLGDIMAARAAKRAGGAHAVL